MGAPDFKAIREAGAALTEITEDAYHYMLEVVPPIYVTGAWAMGEPVTHVEDGPTYFWCTTRGGRYFACYGTRRATAPSFASVPLNARFNRELIQSFRRTNLLAAFDRSKALELHTAAGRRVLVIRSGEMSNPDEGSERATYFGTDGPIGHVTRSDLRHLVAAIDEDWCPALVLPVDDAHCDAWMSTVEFVDGAARVAEIQRLNQGR